MGFLEVSARVLVLLGVARITVGFSRAPTTFLGTQKLFDIRSWPAIVTYMKRESDLPSDCTLASEEERLTMLEEEELMQEIEEGRPSDLAVAKELLGINGFTYILAAAIVFFLAMNTALGPGWLGNTIGLQGTGTFTEMSKSLPETVDLGDTKYLL